MRSGCLRTSGRLLLQQVARCANHRDSLAMAATSQLLPLVAPHSAYTSYPQQYISLAVLLGAAIACTSVDAHRTAACEAQKPPSKARIRTKHATIPLQIATPRKKPTRTATIIIGASACHHHPHPPSLFPTRPGCRPHHRRCRLQTHQYPPSTHCHHPRTVCDHL